MPPPRTAPPPRPPDPPTMRTCPSRRGHRRTRARRSCATGASAGKLPAREGTCGRVDPEGDSGQIGARPTAKDSPVRVACCPETGLG
eukprot:6768567-Alexandrium_andersonii.AAC.1